MTNGWFKKLPQRSTFDKVFLDKVFDVPKNPKYGRCNFWPASKVYKFFDKQSASYSEKRVISDVVFKNQQLEEKLRKPIIRNLKSRKLYPYFKSNICKVDIVDMQLMSKCNKRIQFCFYM